MKNKVFISYSHADEEILKDFESYRKNLEQEGLISVWSDKKIMPGAKWREEIDNALGEADTAILFISENFLASSFIRQYELPPLLSASEAGRVKILPVFLSPSSVGQSGIKFIHPDTGKEATIKLTEFQGFGTPEKTLEELKESKRKRLFTDLANHIRSLVQQPSSDTKGEMEPGGRKGGGGEGVSGGGKSGTAFESAGSSDRKGEGSPRPDNSPLVPLSGRLEYDEDAKKPDPELDKISLDEYRATMRDRLVWILEGNDIIGKELADCYAVRETDKKERAEKTAEKMVDSTPETLLNHLYQIKYRSSGRALDRTGRQTLSDIMHVALPALPDALVRGAAGQIQNDLHRGIPIEINVAMRSVAELALALADGGAAYFVNPGPDETDVPGAFAVERLPVAGRDRKGEQSSRDLAKALESVLKDSPADSSGWEKKIMAHLDEVFITGEARERAPKGEDGSIHPDRISYINNRLEGALSLNKRRYYYATVMPDAEPQRSAISAALKSLKGKFPNIVFLKLSNDFLRLGQETRIYERVAHIRRDEEE